MGQDVSIVFASIHVAGGLRGVLRQPVKSRTGARVRRESGNSSPKTFLPGRISRTVPPTSDPDRRTIRLGLKHGAPSPIVVRFSHQSSPEPVPAALRFSPNGTAIRAARHNVPGIPPPQDGVPKGRPFIQPGTTCQVMAPRDSVPTGRPFVQPGTTCQVRDAPARRSPKGTAVPPAWHNVPGNGHPRDSVPTGRPFVQPGTTCQVTATHAIQSQRDGRSKPCCATERRVGVPRTPRITPTGHRTTGRGAWLPGWFVIKCELPSRWDSACCCAGFLGRCPRLDERLARWAAVAMHRPGIAIPASCSVTRAIQRFSPNGTTIHPAWHNVPGSAPPRDGVPTGRQFERPSRWDFACSCAGFLGRCPRLDERLARWAGIALRRAHARTCRAVVRRRMINQRDTGSAFRNCFLSSKTTSDA